MKTIISFFKFIFFCFVFAFAMLCGFFLYKLETQRNDLKKDSDNIHRICRSNLEGKIAGKPCSMCSMKWSELKSPKDMQEKILRYAEKKFGKKVQDFTNGETKELFYMMRDMKGE